MFGHSGLGDPQERAVFRRAFWFIKTASGKKIWPGQRYVLVKTFFDSMGRPPIHSLSWDRIYTKNEYLMYTLKKDLSS